MFFSNRNKGFAFIGILIALVIVLFLSGQYFKKNKVSQKTYVETQLGRAGDSACAVNRQTLSAGITSWTISHPGEEVTIEKLRKDHVSTPRCPDGGDYIIDNNGNVYCMNHFPPPNQARSEAQSRAGKINPGRSPGVSGAATMDRVRRQLGK
jgi:hypothetical protein